VRQELMMTTTPVQPVLVTPFCRARHVPFPAMDNIRQLLPADRGWVAEITETVTHRNQAPVFPEGTMVVPVVAWALLKDGAGIDPVFAEPTFGFPVTATYYRQMLHDCGEDWKLGHVITVRWAP
jgi:hypothetical protein